MEIFSSCPLSTDVARARYLEYVADVARWSERAGWTGILVHSDNRLVDPWMLSHVIVRNTDTLCPLVAVHPVYMHPYWVAKQITSFGYLYGRRLSLNMVAGGCTTDAEALNDTTPHELRDARLIEYTAIVLRLLGNGGPLGVAGAFYNDVNLKLTPPLSKSLLPRVFVSAQGDSALDAARAMGATAITCPKPASEEPRPANGVARLAIRVGIIARDRRDHAWTIARSRFPEDRRLTHDDEQNPYWLAPFHNGRATCPYLVGSYDAVAGELRRHIARGCQTFVLDVPLDPEELEHVNTVFTRAQLAVAV